MNKPLFSTKPLSVGAEIVDFPWSDINDIETREALEKAWLDHGLLVFSGIETSERHLDLSRCFGDLEPHQLAFLRKEEDPFLTDMGEAISRAYVYDETDVAVNRLAWHRDSAWKVNLCKAAMLRIVSPPTNGGETLFADTAFAYDELPQDMKEKLINLEYKASNRLDPSNLSWPRGYWNTVRLATVDEAGEAGMSGILMDDPRLNVSDFSVVHPVVVEHPETGRKCIFVSPSNFDCFLGLSAEESDELFQQLMSHVVSPRYTYMHTWLPNQAMIWDNFRFIHAALGWHPQFMRTGMRTTIQGTVQTGRDFEIAAA